MKIKRIPLIFCVVIAASVAAAIYVRADKVQYQGSSLGSLRSPNHVGQTTEVRVAAANSVSTRGPSSIRYKTAFAESNNYWAYAHEILPAAKAGDPDAQFYLSRLLEKCDQDNKMFFQHKGQKLTLDEGLQFAVQRHLSMASAQSVFEKCHEFQENDPAELGSAAAWLAKATDAGQPLAQATTASKILMQELMQRFSQASGAPNPNASDVIESNTDPRELLRLAVESKDPEVFFSIGDVQTLLDPTNTDASTNRLAWWLVACERGLDCSANADWVKNTCASDPQCASVDSPRDFVRTLAQDSWPDVEQRAREISAKLDAGKWDELGI
ncbi:MAG TPA: hypothetical protein VME42_02230 [Steroidobacteraceae bacterium]|nr:hypothetical protein [Steroidobacteraceae bacterium]